MCSAALGSLLLIQAMSRNTPPCGLPRPSFDFANDAACHVVARQQFRRTPRILVTLRITPALVFVVGSLRFIIFRNVVEHEAATFGVEQHPAFAAYPFRHQNTCTLSGHTMPVGWNCTNSMSISVAPAS